MIEENNRYNPDISVIIPCYNCANWIVKCLTELENQTYKNFEVICVDDCSKDDTNKIISDYIIQSSLQITLIKNEHNSGPALSRNKAVSIARGNWLAFCDSDDYYDSTFLEEMYNTAEKDGSDLVMCEKRKVYESGRQPEDIHFNGIINENSTVEEIIICSAESLCTLLIKKELFLGNEMPDLRNGEDVACIPCIQANANKISVLKKVLYNYRMRSTSASNTPSKNVYKSMCSAFEHVENGFGGRYPDALEFLGIRTVLYGATLTAFKADVSTKDIKHLVREFSKRYPNWKKNKYLSTLSKSKLLYLTFIKIKMYFMCRVMAYIHTKIIT